MVGAASAYGEEALTTATTLKLARALWIIPIALVSAMIFKNDQKKITIPYFIFFYCAAIAISDLLPQFEMVYQGIFDVSKRALVVCLFLIGCGISVEKLKGSRAEAIDVWYYNVDDDFDRLTSVVNSRITRLITPNT